MYGTINCNIIRIYDILMLTEIFAQKKPIKICDFYSNTFQPFDFHCIFSVKFPTRIFYKYSRLNDYKYSKQLVKIALSGM